jgi:hypothetical protein
MDWQPERARIEIFIDFLGYRDYNESADRAERRHRGTGHLAAD